MRRHKRSIKLDQDPLETFTVFLNVQEIQRWLYENIDNYDIEVNPYTFEYQVYLYDKDDIMHYILRWEE